MNHSSEANEPIAQLLREIAEICEHASLTGAYEGGTARVVRRYNAVLEQLQNSGAITAAMFEPLDPNCSFGEIGVEARMLRSVLTKSKQKDKSRDPDLDVLTRLAPFVRREDLGELIQAQMKSSSVPLDQLVRLAPFLPEDTIHQIVSDHMRGQAEPPKPPEPPAPPAEPTEGIPVPPGGFTSLPMGEDMAKLLEAMKWNELPDAIRAEL